jgi:hypothetical protein
LFKSAAYVFASACEIPREGLEESAHKPREAMNNPEESNNIGVQQSRVFVVTRNLWARSKHMKATPSNLGRNIMPLGKTVRYHFEHGSRSLLS